MYKRQGTCRYELVEYLGYDSKLGKYSTKNTHSQNEIKEALIDLQESNTCTPKKGEKQMSYVEIKKRYGEDHPCASSDKESIINGKVIKGCLLYTSRCV